MGKECCFRLIKRLWGGMKYELPQKPPAWKATKSEEKRLFSQARLEFVPSFPVIQERFVVTD